mmetsp:Transcript_40159/g.99550  ORF Transcript_40159/g.99550 Transcript_40159/m.99550 type:complete len:272 (-) Transcript_40159:293-1108(-)
MSCVLTPAVTDPLTSEWRSSVSRHVRVVETARDCGGGGSPVPSPAAQSASIGARASNVATGTTTSSAKAAKWRKSVLRKPPRFRELATATRSDCVITRSSTERMRRSAVGTSDVSSSARIRPPLSVSTIHVCHSSCSRVAMIAPASESSSGMRPHSSTTSLATTGGSSSSSASRAVRSSSPTASSASICPTGSSTASASTSPIRVESTHAERVASSSAHSARASSVAHTSSSASRIRLPRVARARATVSSGPARAPLAASSTWRRKSRRRR